ncbi:MAG TPA: hotdog fold thioesterase [Ferruginibacter sp.]|nr:hotdog fold thioesterase [Ferruginibacter sp.]HPA23207.1 hotdog fold thioesterase [Ferruginibacter sp.]HQV43232.1 hotdog fold thioesterase [Ferruginibacter sp.]HQW60840.1 hotdog fold thioesterase [Ferruginibacter sp.]HQY17850.1 hotdog fold thioesterase [Ferruginibacter sp.]
MSKPSIWFNKTIDISQLKSIKPMGMSALLGMEWVDIGPDFLKMKMPVSENTIQPYGLLHGGASCSLAETIGSIGSYLVIDNTKYICVGMEINANHIKGVRSGFVTATATPLHLGKSSHVWDIKLVNESGLLVCVSRHTVAIVDFDKIK